MTYNYYQGVMKDRVGRIALALLATALALVTFTSLYTQAKAATAHTFEFTQQELDDNWSADRTYPTGGVASVNAFGRDNVAQLGVDSTQTATGGFHRTEGIKTSGNFGQAVQADLYVDGAWDGIPVRAGLWANGVDDRGDADGPWAITEFTTAGADSHVGWRVWTSGVGWTNLEDVDFTYDEWATLKIELDETDQTYNFFINGELVHTGDAAGDGDVTYFNDIILNSYNYGLEGGSDYQAHWHGGVFDPVEKDECKAGGWEAFGFKNQGQCVRFVNTGKDSR